MASNPSVSNVFQPNTVAESGEVNQNFNDLISWISANAMQRDGSTPFTGIPTLPPVNPTNANHAVRKAYVDSLVLDAAGVVLPAGIIIDFVGTSAPTGWALMNGQVLTNAESLYPNLWAAAPVSWRSGSNMTLPDLASRTTVGRAAAGTFSTVGSTGGSTDAVVVSHSHAVSGTIAISSAGGSLSGTGSFAATTGSAGTHSHTGTASSGGLHNHSGSTGSAGSHSHGPSSRTHFVVQNTTTGTGSVATNPGSVAGASAATNVTATASAGSHQHTVSINSDGTHTHNLSIANGGDHTHSVSGSVSLSGVTVNLGSLSASLNNATAASAGESGSGKNMPPYIVVSKIIKLG